MQPHPLKTYLVNRRQTIRAFAAELGCATITVHKWIARDNRPRWSWARRVEQLTDGEVSAVAMMDGEQTGEAA